MKAILTALAFLLVFSTACQLAQAASQSPDLVPGLMDNWYHYNQGMENIQNGSYEQANKEFDYYLKHPDMHHHMFGIAHFGKGVMFLKLQKLDQALDEFKLAIANDLHPAMPISANAYLNMGTVYMKRKAYDDAIKSYEKCISFDPANGDGHYYLGLAYLRAGNLEKAALESAEAQKRGVQFTALEEDLAAARKQKLSKTSSDSDKPKKNKSKKKKDDSDQ